METLAKNRHETFNEIVGKLFLEYHPEIRRGIHKTYHQNQAVLIEQLMDKTNCILGLFIRDNEAMHFIDISYLFSQPYLNKYLFRIEGFNSLYYLDTAGRSTYYDYSILLFHKEEYFENICKTARNTIRRVMDYELQELEQYFMVVYFMILQEIFSLMVCSDDFTDFLKNKQISVGNPFYIKYGGYLDDNNIMLREWRG